VNDTLKKLLIACACAAVAAIGKELGEIAGAELKKKLWPPDPAPEAKP
jgi:hypothetical protein